VRHEGHATIGRHAPERLYHAARNHLRLARRTPAAGRAHAALRLLAVAALNVASALRGGEIPRGPGVRAGLRGLRDGWTGRAAPPSSSIPDRGRGPRAAGATPARDTRARRPVRRAGG